MRFWDEDGFRIGTSHASDGDAKDPAARERFLQAAGLDPERLVTGKQVHGDRIQTAAEGSPAVFPDTDGLVSVRGGLVLGVFGADCAPVVFWDPIRLAAGIAHAGWRGAGNGIVLRALEALKKTAGTAAGDVKVWIGPHIRDCCYEVGREVAGRFGADAVRIRGPKLFLSLETAVAGRLEGAGVPGNQILKSGDCTFCRPDFFSHRKDRTEKRMLTFVCKVAQA